MKDVHGDTTALLQNNSQVGTYEYDEYGNLNGSTGAADNPYRYCGEYFDEETGFIYLRNRYYDPKIGRFTSEDPAKSGSNWYVYCENNPVKFVDPWGLIITCTQADSESIISLLGELAGNSLEFEYKDGEIKITKTYDTKNHVGQTLVSDLINSSEEINVNIGGDANGDTWNMYNATATDPIKIYIDPDDTLGLGTRGTYVEDSTGAIIQEDIPNFIHFGHELVHAWRDVNGLFVNSWTGVGLIPHDAPQLWREEELQTMGINYTDAAGNVLRNYGTYNGIISENGLRLENGLNTRVSYYYAY